MNKVHIGARSINDLSTSQLPRQLSPIPISAYKKRKADMPPTNVDIYLSAKAKVKDAKE